MSLGTELCLMLSSEHVHSDSCLYSDSTSSCC